jgi:hypothetical protein
MVVILFLVNVQLKIHTFHILQEFKHNMIWGVIVLHTGLHTGILSEKTPHFNVM